jgi:hypothetical protein
MKTNDENLKTLLQHFIDDAAASAMADDIQKGDAMLDRFPAPELGADASERLAVRLRTASAAHRHRRLFLGFAGVATAAMALLVVFLGGSDISPPASSENKPIALAPAAAQVSTLPAIGIHLWDETFYSSGDDSYAAIKDELDSIADSIEAVRVKTMDFPADRYFNRDDVDQRNFQLSTTDFWKG